MIRVVRVGQGSQEILSRPLTKAVRVGFTFLRPGQNVGRHTTGDNEEVIVVLRGRGLLEADGLEHELSEGCVAYVGPRTEHDILNVGDGPLAYIYVVASSE
ncbi:hypothetical protein DRO33_05310 [Candidatus Bathyarchaeota archaeon]|nr:MAG: hypothetical protein DRO33_05310 [Candidatus Bathyarchaeota archaeon]